jgi:hypothetical protein
VSNIFQNKFDEIKKDLELINMFANLVHTRRYYPYINFHSLAGNLQAALEYSKSINGIQFLQREPTDKDINIDYEKLSELLRPLRQEVIWTQYNHLFISF